MEHLKEHADKLRIAIGIADAAETHEGMVRALKQVSDLAHEVQRHAVSAMAVLSLVEHVP